MKLITWNVNGLRAVHKKGLFLPFIETYAPDVLCLQETKAQQHQSEIDLPTYEEYWNSATTRKGYSGTAIFSKTVPLSVQFNFPEALVDQYHLNEDHYGEANKEGRVVAAEYPDFYVVNVYTPNAKGDLGRLPFRHTQWDPAFLAYCKELEKHKPVIFCGDLNVAHMPEDLANPKQNEGEHGFTKEEREGIDRIIKAGFIDVFRTVVQGNGHYTWWSNWAHARERNVGWRIDYFFASKALLPRVRKIEILSNVMGSDHCPVLLELK